MDVKSNNRKEVMKKILLLAVSLSFLALPAQAGNEGGAFIGGLIGGIILNDMFSNRDRHHYYDEHHYHPYRTPRCRTVWERRWDHYEGMYRDVPVRICRRYN